ncbi:MAG: phosphate acyltransferase PlsX [Atribacterota bacterium]|nr:phosphate acyltransferase PlsX [Atribacterota bacterium]
MNIALDIMGGDFSPEETLKGAASFLQKNECEVTLLGNKDIIEDGVKKYSIDINKIKVVDCKDRVENDDLPVEVLKRKPNSPVVIGMDLVKEGKADAFISAGNSGAVMAAALFKLGCIGKIKRPAIAAVIPTMQGRKIILDMGANVDCKPIHLLHFALMGAAYAKAELKVDNPSIGLLNIGEEKGKGNKMSRETYDLLAKRDDLNFIGNIEGRGVFLGLADVTVCDGFTGNIFLKTVEGLAKMFMADFSSNILEKLPDNETTQLLKEKLIEYAVKRDYKTYGGAPLLGINGLCFICHGRSKSIAIKNALANACMFIENRGLEYIKNINF